MASPQLWGYGVHALPVLQLLLLLLLPLRVTPGRERHAPEQGTEGDPNAQLNLIRVGRSHLPRAEPGVQLERMAAGLGGWRRGEGDTWREPGRAQVRDPCLAPGT